MPAILGLKESKGVTAASIILSPLFLPKLRIAEFLPLYASKKEEPPLFASQTDCYCSYKLLKVGKTQPPFMLPNLAILSIGFQLVVLNRKHFSKRIDRIVKLE